MKLSVCETIIVSIIRQPLLDLYEIKLNHVIQTTLNCYGFTKKGGLPRPKLKLWNLPYIYILYQLLEWRDVCIGASRL